MYNVSGPFAADQVDDMGHIKSYKPAASMVNKNTLYKWLTHIISILRMHAAYLMFVNRLYNVCF